ncbi:transcription initiation factor TFIID subunit 9B-like [Sycon ciliatum]|uniref:transcription initiation factor TFIID subunit 9B-like n=1 Tax=Sycon ciliatum TaxID=27933 RepID=UPI0020A8B39B|eukprot:scpid102661/ scgid15764/ Transcription initiation factor TFIID subunit 9; RNA polymerase II TBP-associated factor subunit G; STAF31/32; Transcription initiation factor TFIID 31 kDa subunit; Transcription initiation factor TFIID 32 kDa subunit
MASTGGNSTSAGIVNDGSSGAHGQANAGCPKDALVMSAILKEMGVLEYEPQVVRQMLEFTYRHVTTVLEEARVLSDHAGKAAIDAQDAKVAVNIVAEHSFVGPPPREFMLELAKEKNEKPLPAIVEKNGQRLPAERYCLLGNNFQVKHVKPSKQKQS